MRMFSDRRRIKQRIVIFLLIFAAVLSVISWRVVSVVYEISNARAKYVTTLAVNRITAQYLTRCAEMYDGILVREKSDSGKISAINTDISKINMLQTEISAQVLSELSEHGVYDITLPVLNLFGMRTLTAWGPRLKMELAPTSNVTARFEDSFTSAGINQTKFSVNLVVDVDVLVTVSPVRSTVHVSYSMPVVQLILLGDVPGTYADIKR